MWHALERFSVDRLSWLLPENIEALNFGSIVRLAYLIFPAMSLWHQKMYIQWMQNKWGKSAFKMTSLWAGSNGNLCPASVSQSYSSLHRPSQENRFSRLMWYSVMLHMLLQNFYCFWLEDYKIHSKPFRLHIYWWQGRKYWQNASTVTVSALSMICSVAWCFSEPHFAIFCIAKLDLITWAGAEKQEAVNKGVPGPEVLPWFLLSASKHA
jgi:hypothetical protein